MCFQELLKCCTSCCQAILHASWCSRQMCAHPVRCMGRCLPGPRTADFLLDAWHVTLQMARENARTNVAEARRNFHEARDGEQAKLAEMEPLRKAKAGDSSRVQLTHLAEFKDLMVKTEADLDQLVGC